MNFEKTSSLNRDARPSSGRHASSVATLGFVHARAGHGAAIDELLLQGMSPNSADSEGRTLLMIASAAGHAHIVRSLLESGADIDRRDSMGHTALFEAVAQQNTEMVALLIHLGADAELPDLEGCTPLMLACDWGYDAVVDVLCRTSVNLHQRDRRGRTAHERALLAGHSGCAGRIESAQRQTDSGSRQSIPADLDLPWMVEAPSVSATNPAPTGPQELRSSSGSVPTVQPRTDAPEDSGLDMRTPLPGVTQPSEPVQLLRSVTAAYEQLVSAVRQLAAQLTHSSVATAALQDIQNILSLRGQIVEDLCFGYLVRSDGAPSAADPGTQGLLIGAGDSVSLQSVISLFDAVASSVNWAVMILDSHGDDEGAESLRDARRELTRAARVVRKLAEV